MIKRHAHVTVQHKHDIADTIKELIIDIIR